MKKYKIAVYAICKNEEKHIKRWYESVKEADTINVLDTGSTDKSVELLKSLGVDVKTKEIIPFRFDIARNESLKLVPTDTDICVCLDIDEVLSSGWREEIEAKWENDTTIGEYTLNATLDDNLKPIVSFNIKKIHKYNEYEWVYPVHEVLSFKGNNEKVIKLNIEVNHLPDNEKSRSIYLPLLIDAVKENPNDRNLHYLGREYMFYKKYNEAIEVLHKHLKISIWKEERCASMRFMGRCYKELGRMEEARMWFEKSLEEAPHLRDPYVELAFFEYQNNNFKKSSILLKKALEIKNNPKTYINEKFSYNYFVYDLLSICEYNIGNKKEAIEYLNIALELEPNNERLLKNLEFMKSQDNS